ncbi:hypothetical protein IKG12_01540 [Candidatus Saccharibacteria bacterium]|nr:hypothetical protein [Candidatus Saccharibacteria bacterium]
MKDKKNAFAFAIPDWVKDVKSDEVYGAIVGLLFGWAWDGKEEEIPNLKKYVADSFDDMSEAEIAEVCNLLIEHGVVKSK